MSDTSFSSLFNSLGMQYSKDNWYAAFIRQAPGYEVGMNLNSYRLGRGASLNAHLQIALPVRYSTTNKEGEAFVIGTPHTFQYDTLKDDMNTDSLKEMGLG